MTTSRKAPVDVAALAYPGCIAAGIAIPLDGLAIGNTLATLVGDRKAAPLFATRVIAARTTAVDLGNGMVVNAKAVGRAIPEVLIVPPMLHRSFGDLQRQLERLGPEVALIRRCHDAGAVIAMGCAGAFLVAESGVLDGHTITTSWWLGDLLKRRYPKVRIALDRLVFEDGPFLSSGPASAQFDLYTRLVQRYGGPELAALCARVWTVEPGRESQSAHFVEALRPNASDPLVAKVQTWLRERVEADVSLDQMAAVGSTSPRNLIRRFKQAIDDTPLGYLQRLRIDRAKHLLTTSQTSVTSIMERAGYADLSSFRKLFRTHTGLTPIEYRARFQIGKGMPTRASVR